jgi:ribosome-associated translation inhibitor RaiA
MQIEVSTDNHIKSSAKLEEVVKDLTAHGLKHYSSHITRVEVHLADENGSRVTPDDKRCTMEARLEGRKPTVATAHGDTVEAAVRGAVNKLGRVLESELGRLEARR